jgi:hypothetical protein
VVSIEAMKRYFLWLPVIFLCLTLGYHVVAVWRGVVLSQEGTSKETLSRAIGVDPDNPMPFHKLGLLHQWSLLQTDLRESERFFQEAIEKNPLEQEYWFDLAKVIKAKRKGADVERAIVNAILVFPTGYRGRWIAGNLLLEQGDIDKALLHSSYILTHYPEQSRLVYAVFEKVADDADFVLEHLIPKDPSSFEHYLAYLYEVGEKEPVRNAWGKKVEFGFKPDQKETLRYIDFLISKGELNQAYQIWRSTLVSPDGNLISNGGFETDSAPGSGFDWKIGKVKGAEILFDDSVFLEGKRSLKITFDGKENVDFQQISQLVSWRPETEYLLKAYMKTKGITTRSGLKMEISGIGVNVYGASESVTGDNEWKELTVRFRTPAHSQGGQVRVRRERTDKFDRLISGEVWIDAVRLSEEPLGTKSGF